MEGEEEVLKGTKTKYFELFPERSYKQGKSMNIFSIGYFNWNRFNRFSSWSAFSSCWISILSFIKWIHDVGFERHRMSQDERLIFVERKYPKWNMFVIQWRLQSSSTEWRSMIQRKQFDCLVKHEKNWRQNEEQILLTQYWLFMAQLYRIFLLSVRMVSKFQVGINEQRIHDRMDFFQDKKVSNMQLIQVSMVGERISAYV